MILKTLEKNNRRGAKGSQNRKIGVVGNGRHHVDYRKDFEAYLNIGQERKKIKQIIGGAIKTKKSGR
jgi:hypothetical protein